MYLHILINGQGEKRMFNQYPIGVLTIQHPDNGTMTIAEVIRTYAWHGKHHIAHITTLRKQKNW